MTCWRVIPSYPDYVVSTEGQVARRDPTWLDAVPGRILKPYYRFGYLRVSLRAPGRRKCALVHRLVAEAFIGPSVRIVRHMNDVRTDNRLENLRYGTHKENYADSVRNGHRPPRPPRTHCTRGHALTEFTTESGIRERRCNVCRRAQDRAAKQRLDHRTGRPKGSGVAPYMKEGATPTPEGALAVTPTSTDASRKPKTDTLPSGRPRVEWWER